MGSEYITLDHPRVELVCSRPGRVYSLSGNTQTREYPHPHTIFENGFHLEPRMGSVLVPPKSFNLNPGDSAAIRVENSPLVGVVLELADHHFDLKVFVDGEDIYQDFGCLSTYLPSSDGFGKIHWLLLDRDPHLIELRVTDQYNRMLDASKIQPSHACISGFILLNEIHFPPSIIQQWMYTQDPIPPDTRGRTGHFKNSIIPPDSSVFLMDLYGHGTLETLSFETDQPQILEIMDGGIAQPEYPHDFPSWIRRIDLGKPDSGALDSVVAISEIKQKDRIKISLIKPLIFASRLIIRLTNPGSNNSQIHNLYLEGTSHCR